MIYCFLIDNLFNYKFPYLFSAQKMQVHKCSLMWGKYDILFYYKPNCFLLDNTFNQKIPFFLSLFNVEIIQVLIKV